MSSLVALIADDTRVLFEHLSERGLSSDMREVRSAEDLAALAQRHDSAVLLAHGGSAGLGPTTSEVWADAAALGETFRNPRVYAFACETVGGANSLGARSVAAGIRVFVGHDKPITAPVPKEARGALSEVATAIVEAFLNGEDDTKRLRDIAYDAHEAVSEGVALDVQVNAGGDFWMRAKLHVQLAASLDVCRRTE